MILEVAGRTDVGRKRGRNEDAILMAPEDSLFCVADGMGGHQSGEVASALAVSELASHFAATRGQTIPPEERLAEGLRRGDRKILEAGFADAACFGMGTTAVALHFREGKAHVAHVGDSRAYRFSRGRLARLTEDHSLLNDYIRSGRIKPEDAARFPHKNIILRALGMREELVIEFSEHAPLDGDIYLLCSDGLTGMVADDRLAELIAAESRHGSLEVLAGQLIDAANAAGGNDNISCILVRCRKG